MTLDKIIGRVNDKLAGEMLTYDELIIHLDAVVDDINIRLSANYPAFSEFNIEDHPDYPNYNFFPDKYIRSVVVPGAAYKFYITDEEGIDTAQNYGYEYQNALFYMTRDYSDLVDEKYMDDDVGYLTGCPHNELPTVTFNDIF